MISQSLELPEIPFPGQRANLYELGLFGLPPSMLRDPPSISREDFQPLDLATANKYWRANYDAPSDALHFASCYVDQIGHGDFLFEDGRITRHAAGGTSTSEWAGFDTYLTEELDRMKATGQVFADLLSDLKDYLD
ncbi:MAG: hypothetical protein R3D67_02500 [Hyphomicrobiaceae bacterium]